MTPPSVYRIPQGLSPCCRYRAMWHRGAGGLWLVFDLHATSTREPEPVATYWDASGLTVALVLEVFEQERAAVPVEVARA